MAVDIWRDIANNKVYVKNGLETIEVPHAIAEAYRQDEARLFKELEEEHALVKTLESCYEYSKIENAKLREQLRLREDTCTADETEAWNGLCMSRPIRQVRNLTVHVMECSKCGHTYEHVNGSYEYCPHCGRKVAE